MAFTGNRTITLSHRRAAGWLLLTGVLLLSASTPAAAQTPAQQMPEVFREVAFEQKHGDTIPLDLTFQNEAGETVELSHYFGDKPVLLNLVYLECPMLCNVTMQELVKVLRTMDFEPGREFTILTVSFDHREKPSLARRSKTTAMRRYGRDDAAEGWHFLTGNQENIKKLTDSVGFHFQWDEETGRFAHAAGLIVLTPKGTVSRYLDGVEYTATDLRFSLIEASENKIGTAKDKLLLLMCFHYDPTIGKYGLAVVNGLRVIGSLTVLLVGGYIFRSVRRERRKKKEAPSADFSGSSPSVTSG